MSPCETNRFAQPILRITYWIIDQAHRVSKGRESSTDPHRDLVLREMLTEADSGIESSGVDIVEGVAQLRHQLGACFGQRNAAGRAIEQSSGGLGRESAKVCLRFKMPAGRAKFCLILRHCERSEAIQSRCAVAGWIAWLRSH